MANKKLTPLQILYKEFKNAKTDAARNDAWRRFEIKRGEMYPPRSDRKSAMLRDSAAVAAKYPTKVLGGENHRYYEPGRRIRMDVDETAKRSPEVFVDPQTGERYVRGFHYTQPENIESILQNGLVSRIGPDSKNFQNRPGVWVSFGNENPMPYDYVNNAYIGDKGYAMEPLEIRIPEEEWKAMPMDHTGITGKDQVMVFRPSKTKPYGTVEVAGEKATVTIPPEYISRYEFPKDWETSFGSSKSLRGYTPNRPKVYVSDEGFYNRLPKNITEEARNELGNGASYNDINQWVIDNRQKQVKKSLESSNYNFVPDFERTRLDESKKYFNEHKSVDNLWPEANRAYFNSIDFATPYDLQLSLDKMPTQRVGFIQKGYPNKRNAFSAFYHDDEAPRTKKFIRDNAGDRTPISGFARWFEIDKNAKPILSSASSQGISIPNDALYIYSNEYLDDAGVRKFDGRPTFENNNYARTYFNGYGAPRYDRNQLKNEIKRWNSWLYKEAYKNDQGYHDAVENFLNSENREDAEKAMKVVQKYKADLLTPEKKKERQKDILKLNEQKTIPWDNPSEIAKQHSWLKALRTDEYSDAMSKEVDKYLEQHPELDFDKDYDNAYRIVQKHVGDNVTQPIADKFYPEELQKVRQNLVEDWKKQFSNDSLNRVFGHELGRKVGKYRASRGKPVNPKQL